MLLLIITLNFNALDINNDTGDNKQVQEMTDGQQ